ncbi:MAG: DNA-directed RNA polymerase subunit omega [Chitinivibrionales bacterium]
MDQNMMEVALDELEKKGINRYKAVLMAAQEARFINDQVRLGIVKSEDKPTTTALKRLFEGRVVENENAEAEG